MDHKGLYPWQTDEIKSSSNVAQIFLSLTNELTIPKILIYPVDNRQPATNWVSLSSANISFFIGLNSSSNEPRAILSGDRNVTIDSRRANSGRIRIATNSILGWDSTQHHYLGNLCMGDGSVQIGNNNARFNDTMRRANFGTSSAVFLFP